MSDLRKATVYVQDIAAGILSETEDGYEFRYNREYLNIETSVPVSLTLPLSEEAYFSRSLFPFFDGLIPEGWLLEQVKRNWKISNNDRFGLLLVSCRDAIGDVHILPYSDEIE